MRGPSSSKSRRWVKGETMRQFSIGLSLSVSLALVGCAAPISFPSLPETPLAQVQPEFEPGDLVLRLRIGDSRTLQAGGDPVVVYNVADVAYLEILPFVRVGEDFVPMSSAGKPTTEEAADRLKVTTTDRHQTYFVFKNLPPDQTYRFRARAYDTDHTLISKDAESVTDVTFTRVEYANTPALQLKLKDKPFMGTAKATVVTSGDMGTTHRIVATLYKKGSPDVQVGTEATIEADALGSGRSLLLGGLAPHTSYVLKAEARDASNEVLTSGSVEWTVGDDQELASQILTLSFGVQVFTYAGSTMGDQDGTLTTARFGQPFALAKGPNGDLFVADAMYHRIRRIDAAGNVTVFAGSGGMANVPGTGTEASTREPMGLAFDSTGNLFVSSYQGHAILKITPAGDVSVFAGSGLQGSTDGKGTAASFDRPMGLCVDTQDHLYVADTYNHRIRKIAPDGTVSTWAGSTQGFNDANGTSARFDYPMGLAIDGAQNLYVADASNRRIRMITPGQEVTTVAGSSTPGSMDGLASSATFMLPQAVTVAPDGSLYVSDLSSIRRIKAGQVTTVAGGPSAGSADGPGAQAQFSLPAGSLFLTDSSLLVADRGNFRIRRIALPPSY